MKKWETVEPDKYALVGPHRFTRGRARPIDRIVIHHNAANNWTTEQVRDLWNNSRVASAHYQVESNGTIGQIVNDSDTAWHAANADINSRSIAVEHANISGPPRWQISDKTIEEGAHLVGALCRAYQLGPPVWDRNVFPHSLYAPTSCPLQLAPGGEDHALYIERMRYWYDHPGGTAPGPTPKGDDMTPEQAHQLDDIHGQLTGSTKAGEFPGWPQLGGRTLVDALALIGAERGLPGFKAPGA